MINKLKRNVPNFRKCLLLRILDEDEYNLLKGINIICNQTPDIFRLVSHEILYRLAHDYIGTSSELHDDTSLRQCSDDVGNDPFGDLAKQSATCTRLVKYLSARGFITIKQGGVPVYTYGVAPTFDGIEFCKNSRTLFGAMGLWYKYNKDGLLWLLMTVCVSGLVSFIVSSCTN